MHTKLATFINELVSLLVSIGGLSVGSATLSATTYGSELTQATPLPAKKYYHGLIFGVTEYRASLSLKNGEVTQTEEITGKTPRGIRENENIYTNVIEIRTQPVMLQEKTNEAPLFGPPSVTISGGTLEDMKWTNLTPEETRSGDFWNWYCVRIRPAANGEDLKVTIQYQGRLSKRSMQGAVWIYRPLIIEKDMVEGWCGKKVASCTARIVADATHSIVMIRDQGKGERVDVTEETVIEPCNVFVIKFE